MKKELLISTIILIVLMGGTFLLIRNRVTTSPSSLPTKTTTGTTKSPVTTAPSTTASLLTVQTHNNPDDCWIIVNKKAYDVSSYMTAHPGEAKTIVPFCGKESTQAFDTIKDGRGHSIQASMDLDLYFVADVE